MKKATEIKLHKHKSRIRFTSLLIVVFCVTAVVLFVRWSIMRSDNAVSLKVDDAAVTTPSDDIVTDITVLPGGTESDLPPAFTGDVILKGLMTAADGRQVALLELSTGSYSMTAGDTLANVAVSEISDGKVSLTISEVPVLLDLVNNKYTIPAGTGGEQ